MGRAKISLLTRWWYSKVSEQTSAEIDKFQLKSHRTVHTLFELEWTFNFPNDIARAGQKRIYPIQQKSVELNGDIVWNFFYTFFLLFWLSDDLFVWLAGVNVYPQCTEEWIEWESPPPTSLPIWSNSFSSFHTLLPQQSTPNGRHIICRASFFPHFSLLMKRLKRHESSSLSSSSHLKCSFNDELVENELEGDEKLVNWIYSENMRNYRKAHDTRHDGEMSSFVSWWGRSLSESWMAGERKRWKFSRTTKSINK